MIEYNILTKLQEMTMVSTTYKLKNRLSYHDVAQTLVDGFIGQLKDGGITISHLRIGMVS